MDRFFSLLLLAASIPIGCSQAQARPPIRVNFEERHLGTLPEGDLKEWFNVSDAYVAENGGKSHLVLDGVKTGPFDRAWMPVFRHDSRKVAFGARKGRDLWWHVIDVPR